MIIGTMFFSASTRAGGRTFGWSESHVMMTAGEDLTQGLIDLTALANKRVDLLGAGVTLTYMRVSRHEIKRDSLIESGIKPSQADVPYYNHAFKDKRADFAYSTLLLRCQLGLAPFVSRCSKYLSGNPDLFQEAASLPTDNADWRAAFALYKRLLIGGRYGQKCLNLDPVTNPEKPIIGAAIVNGELQLTCINHGFNTGTMVRISGLKGEGNNPNGVWELVKVNDTAFTLNGYSGEFTRRHGGTVRERKYTALPYTDVIIRRYASRRRGRPFDSPVSARRKK